jgi:excisionase family DNA binding protein
LRAMADRNEVPHLKIGRRVLIPRQAFMNWFNTLGDQKPSA